MNKLYDVHFHAMNLSHPNLLAFVRKVDLRLALMASPPLAWLVGLFGGRQVDMFKNLVSVMENDLGDFFLIVEWYLRNEGIARGREVKVGDRVYDGIVLVPLMLDFGYKNITSGGFYKIPAQKPIVEQVVDVFNGIAKYSRYDLEVEWPSGDGGEVSCKYVEVDKGKKLFEIYPFLGLNTKNYKLDKLQELLDKYFGGYPLQPRARHELLYEKLGTFQGDIEKLGAGFFAGVKVYPPLGFDPWPEDAQELKKVELLYKYCADRRIPITTHCSDGGFITADNYEALTSPDKWVPVVSEYPSLPLDLAHLGVRYELNHLFSRHAWDGKVRKLVRDTSKNVYSDFSGLAKPDELYGKLRELLGPGDAARDRVLFGSDFVINLLWSESYNEHLRVFAQTKQIGNDAKHLVCNVNPERFLFGGSV